MRKINVYYRTIVRSFFVAFSLINGSEKDFSTQSNEQQIIKTTKSRRSHSPCLPKRKNQHPKEIKNPLYVLVKSSDHYHQSPDPLRKSKETVGKSKKIWRKTSDPCSIPTNHREDVIQEYKNPLYSGKLKKQSAPSAKLSTQEKNKSPKKMHATTRLENSVILYKTPTQGYTTAENFKQYKSVNEKNFKEYKILHRDLIKIISYLNEGSVTIYEWQHDILY